MTIEADIVAWAKTRPAWQQLLLKRIASGQPLDSPFIAGLVQDVVNGTVTGPLSTLDAADLPTQGADVPTVSVLALRDVQNVNALLPNQTLTFGPAGMTVVYGDNGSGKSGYARLLKVVTDARHKQAVLPNAFVASTGTQHAMVDYVVGRTEFSGEWPGLTDPALHQVHFYDEACGDDYLATDTELAYRPSVLRVVDTLIWATDQLRAEVERLILENAQKAQALPRLDPATSAGAFITSISHSTRSAEIDTALDVPPTAAQDLASLVQEEARLLTTDPVSEKQRLTAAVSDLEATAAQFDLIESHLGAAGATAAFGQAQAARDARAAADLASRVDFADEPLAGVGSGAWRALWRAAEAYSLAHPYPTKDFPANDDMDRCVLCQQVLGDDARARLGRFHAFVHNETASTAAGLEADVGATRAVLEGLSGTPMSVTAALGFLVNENRPLARALKDALETAEVARRRLLEHLDGVTGDDFEALADVDIEAIRNLAATVGLRAAEIDGSAFAAQLAAVTSQKTELSDRLELAKYASQVREEVARRGELHKLTAAKAAMTTGPMTTKANELSRAYVTVAVSDRFSRESDRLGLEHVVLGDRGGTKGKLKHKPALLGASAGRTTTEVLSEGEQTALGLAGFFTEIYFDDSKSSVVFDDPITSLDHGRREKAAKRIATLAADRQVVVFTHDLTFLGDLVRAAAEVDVPITERSISRSGGSVPGLVHETHPWKAKDAKKRLGDLAPELASLKREQADLDEDEYERRVSDWAGKLSETWERMVRLDVVNKVVERGTGEVKPKMIKLLAAITDDDNRDFQNGYSQVSKWARRHDKSEEVNFTAPTIDEMQAELDRAVAWQKRLSGYAAGS